MHTKRKKIVQKSTRRKSSRTSVKRDRVSRPLVLATVGVVVILALSTITTTHRYAPKSSNVLGADEEVEKKTDESAKEAEKHVQETQKEAEKQSAEKQSEQPKQSNTDSNTPEPTERPEPAVKKESEVTANQSNEIKKASETEIETASGQKIKTKVEDNGTTKIEVENGSVKLKYRIENGQIVLAAEDEAGQKVEMSADKLNDLGNSVGDQLQEDNVKLLPTSDNQLAVVNNSIAATTTFPLSIDVGTKQLIVTTDSGQKVVAVLPDQAVQNLLATGIITKIASPSGSLITTSQTPLTGVVSIQTQNDKVVYKVSGIKTQKLFGLIPVDTQTTALVSADSGQLVGQQRSLMTDIIDFLSP